MNILKYVGIIIAVFIFASNIVKIVHYLIKYVILYTFTFNKVEVLIPPQFKCINLVLMQCQKFLPPTPI
jgi:hypothetical protein